MTGFLKETESVESVPNESGHGPQSVVRYLKCSSGVLLRVFLTALFVVSLGQNIVGQPKEMGLAE